MKNKGGIQHRIICGVSASTYAVFLIHTHICLRGWIWDDVVKPLEHLGNWLYMIAVVVGILIICTAIDYIRRGIFYPLENNRSVDVLASRIEQKVFGTAWKETE